MSAGTTTRPSTDTNPGPTTVTGPGGGTNWAQDLLLGAKFAVTGGREGWMRTLLTGLGVGLGVLLLLFAASVPNATSARDDRESNRNTYNSLADERAEDTLLVTENNSTFRDENITVRLVRPEGPEAPVPPGLDRYPASGEMMVSPALAALLDTAEGERLLQPRIPYEQVGTISESGLIGPHELAYYAGSDKLNADDGFVDRIDSFGEPTPTQPWDPVLLLLVAVMLVVLLAPVAVFIAAAVRFGGERRDRRLAALRLIGAERSTTARIAAGEALGGALVGVVMGIGLFLAGRQLVGEVELPIFETGIFPSDINPNPLLALLVVVGVPLASVAVTLLAMRGVAIEPLGVVRTSKPPRRRLWWRLLMPLAGLALLYPMIGQKPGEEFNQWQVTGGVLLLLIGVTALLPWLVEFAVTRLGGGSVAWQLAVRRLQLTSGVAVRPVNGIAVAVAGAIALQSLFTGIEGDFTRDTGVDPGGAQLEVLAPSHIGASRMPGITEEIASAKGVRSAISLADSELGEKANNPEQSHWITVGDCASLREVAKLERCADGDVFLTPPDLREVEAKPGQRLYFDANFDGYEGNPTPWTVPADARTVEPRPDPTGHPRSGIIATLGALPENSRDTLRYNTFVTLDPDVPDVYEHVRNAVAQADPLLTPMTLQSTEVNERFAAVKRGLLIGSAAVLLLIGASLLVSQLEQLRERRRLLAALVAFGTRRRTLALSVLWQTAVPIVLGLVLACGTGLALGAVLLGMVGEPVSFDWASVAAMSGIGAGVVLLVTVLSLPPLWRMMRPEGLRTE